ncbi:hypothetical protein ACHAQJ_003336 [Trichoderma viride]
MSSNDSTIFIIDASYQVTISIPVRLSFRHRRSERGVDIVQCHHSGIHLLLQRVESFRLESLLLKMPKDVLGMPKDVRAGNARRHAEDMERRAEDAEAVLQQSLLDFSQYLDCCRDFVKKITVGGH